MSLRKRDILRAVQDGERLMKYADRWELGDKPVHAGYCRSLWQEGSLMEGQWTNGQWPLEFLITDKGKAAL